MHLCERKFVVFQVDAHNLMWVVNRGSPRLLLNELARVVGASLDLDDRMGPKGGELLGRRDV